MNIFEKLLETDLEKITKRHSVDVEIKRLSEILGEPFILTITPISLDEIECVREEASDETNFKELVLVESVRLSGVRLNNKEVLKKFSVADATSIVGKMFLAGETRIIFEKIYEVSGFNIDAVLEVKKP